jgi:hypothetical protein
VIAEKEKPTRNLKDPNEHKVLQLYFALVIFSVTLVGLISSFAD